jgi:hypothetical protein
MPPIPPPGIPGAALSFFGLSATMASVVIKSPAIDADLPSTRRRAFFVDLPENRHSMIERLPAPAQQTFHCIFDRFGKRLPGVKDRANGRSACWRRSSSFRPASRCCLPTSLPQCRTGLGHSETEIGKWRAETGAAKATSPEPKVRNLPARDSCTPA